MPEINYTLDLDYSDVYIENNNLCVGNCFLTIREDGEWKDNPRVHLELSLDKLKTIIKIVNKELAGKRSCQKMKSSKSSW